MKLKMTFRKMPAYRQKFLDADFQFANEEVHYQLCDAIEKIRYNRGFSYKILNMIRKVSKGMDMTVEGMLASFDASADMPFMNFKIVHRMNECSVVELEINDTFFVMFEELKKTTHIPIIGYSRKDFVRHLEKEAKRKFTNDFTIEEVA